MRIHLVTRHPGAVDWAAQLGVQADRVCEHLSADEVDAGDIVIGVLPLGLAAEICERGARVFALTVQLPRELRGRELGAEALRAHGARLQEYDVRAGVDGEAALAMIRLLRAGKRADCPGPDAGRRDDRYDD